MRTLHVPFFQSFICLDIFTEREGSSVYKRGYPKPNRILPLCYRIGFVVSRILMGRRLRVKMFVGCVDIPTQACMLGEILCQYIK